MQALFRRGRSGTTRTPQVGIGIASAAFYAGAPRKYVRQASSRAAADMEGSDPS